MRRPGQWLRLAAARVCAKQTLERVIDPIVADIQMEHEEAIGARRSWRAAWIRVSGYSAFWKAVGLHTLRSGPRALWNCLAEDGWTLGRTIAYSLVAFISLTLLLAALPMVEFYSRVQNLEATVLLLPQAIPLSIPVALPLAIVCTVYGARVSRRRIRAVLFLAAAATLFAFAAILAVPEANQAFRVAVARELGDRGITKYSLPRGMNELSSSQLARESREYDASGFSQKAREFRRAYHLRFALPPATFVLSLLALGVGATTRGRLRRVVAMAIAFGLYWAALAVAEWNTILPAGVWVWAPNVVFTAMSLALLRVSSGRPGPALPRQSGSQPTACGSRL